MANDFPDSIAIGSDKFARERVGEVHKRRVAAVRLAEGVVISPMMRTYHRKMEVFREAIDV